MIRMLVTCTVQYVQLWMVIKCVEMALRVADVHSVAEQASPLLSNQLKWRSIVNRLTVKWLK